MKNALFLAVVVSSLSYACLGVMVQEPPMQVIPPSPIMRTVKESKAWEDICEQSKNAVIQILTFAKSPNILEPFRSPTRLSWRGSGFFIKPEGFEEGYIISNFHVVEEKELCFMQLPALSKERFLLDVIGTCPQKDFALLKLSVEDCRKIKTLLGVKVLPHVKLGDSDTVFIGEEVMALGYPGCTGCSVGADMENLKGSKGNISGRESTYLGESIQTTAAINHGNSGGPVVDQTGSVIGISTMGPLKSENEGMSFLVPINNIKIYLNQLKKGTLIRLPFWGIESHPTTTFELEQWKAPTDGGFRIKKVYKSSLAEEAGIQKNDIIYQVNSILIDRFGQVDSPWGTGKIKLNDYLDRLEIGSTATFVVYRNGQKLTCPVTIKMRSVKKIDVHYSAYEDLPPYEIIGGLVISEFSFNHLFTFLNQHRLDPQDSEVHQFARYAEPDNCHESRLIISSVLPDSQGDKTRCFDGSLDRILSKVNGIPVKTIEDFRTAVLTSVGKPSLTIETEGGTVVELAVADMVAEEEILRIRNEDYPRSPLIDALGKGLS